MPPFMFASLTLLICMLAAWEWSQLAGFIARSHRFFLAIICGFLLLLIMLYFPKYSRVVHLFLWLSLVWWAVALLLVLFYPHSAAVWRHAHSHSLRLIFGLLTIVPFFGGTIALRQYGDLDNQFTGAWYLLYVMLLVWGVDSGAYMCGKLFGKHKLAPKVSPGKTWEGLIGGLITSVLISWLFGRYLTLNIVPVTLLGCSVIAALASVLGDLVESMFKREVGLKDSGCLMPGHGGILDRIDSLTAAVPIFSYMIFVVL